MYDYKLDNSIKRRKLRSRLFAIKNRFLDASAPILYNIKKKITNEKNPKKLIQNGDSMSLPHCQM